MKSSLVLVGILVILIIVVAALSFVLDSQISDLTSKYASLYSNYETAYNDLGKLNASYYNLTSEYNTLANEYNELHGYYLTATGMETAYKLFDYILSGDEKGIIGYVTNSTQVYISQGKVNGTLTGQAKISGGLAEFYRYEFVRGNALELEVNSLGNAVYGVALVQYSNQLVNGSEVDEYAVVSLFLSYNGTGWYIAKLYIYNDFDQQTYTDALAVFSLLKDGIEALSSPTINQYMIGQYPSYIYISTGPLAGNYTPIMFDGELSKVSSFDFKILYYNFTPVSPGEVSFKIYANITIVLSNSSTFTYPAIITGYAIVQSNGLPEVTQLVINNSVQYSAIVSDIESYM